MTKSAIATSNLFCQNKSKKKGYCICLFSYRLFLYMLFHSNLYYLTRFNLLNLDKNERPMKNLSSFESVSRVIVLESLSDINQ